MKTVFGILGAVALMCAAAFIIWAWARMALIMALLTWLAKGWI